MIARGRSQLNVSVSLVSVRALLAGGWSSGKAPAVMVAFGKAGRRGTSDAVYGSYLFGIAWETGDTRLLVKDVLAGSPADSAGISVGDQIVAIDGTPVKQAGSELASKLLPGDSKSTIELSLVRGSSTRKVIVTSEAISRVVHSLDLLRDHHRGASLLAERTPPTAPTR